MKKALIIVGCVLLVLLAIAVAVPFFIDANQFRPTVESQLTTALGRKVSIGDLSLSILRGRLTASAIAIADDPAFSSSPFVRAKALDISVELMPLIASRAVHVQSLILEQPNVQLIRSDAGTWNFSSVGHRGTPAANPRAPQPAGSSAGGSVPNFSVSKIVVANGRVALGTRGHPPHLYENVSFRAQNVSYTSRFPFHLEGNMPGGGQLKVDGQAGPVDQRDASRTPFTAQATVNRFDVARSGLLDPGAGISGVVDLQSKVRSDGSRAQAQGTLKADKLCLVKGCRPASQPVNVDYSSQYDLARQTGAISNTRVRTGKSVIDMAGNYDLHGSSPVLHMKLNAPTIPVADIQALLPAMGVILPQGSSLQSGTATTHLSVDGAVDRLVTTGDVSLANARLAGFNLGSKLSALSMFSGLKPGSDTLIQLLSSKLRIAPEGIRSDDLKLVVADLGTMTGAGTIASNSAMNFKMLAQLTGGGAVGNLITRVGMGGAASRGIPFSIQGTTSRPVFVPDVGGMLRGRAGAGSQLQQNAPAQDLGNMLGQFLKKKKQ